MAIDYYSVLGVEPQATPEEIKRAFRRLAREHHPDANNGDPEAERRYKEISEAYAVLSDAERRRRYDAERMGVGGYPPFATTIEDLFDTFFGGAGATGRGGRQRTRAARGESIEIQLEVDFADAVFGAERRVTFSRLEPCVRCEGSGSEPGSHPVRCDRCDGTGQLQQARRTILGSVVTAYPCAACGQTGWVIPNPCKECRGDGRVAREMDVTVTVPSGIETGDRMRISGQGEAGFAGGPHGDLYVRFVVRPDDRFARSGDDLVTWVDIPMTTAALGGEVTFTSLDGEEHLEVPRGTHAGDVFRIPGRGLVRGRGGARGDLVVRAHVLTPTGLDDEQEELLRRLAEVRDEPTGTAKGFASRLRRVLGMEG